MEEKRADLKSQKQKDLLDKILSKLSADNPQIYYESTSQVAYQIEDYLKGDNDLSMEELELLSTLDAHDIQLILSLHTGERPVL